MLSIKQTDLLKTCSLFFFFLIYLILIKTKKTQTFRGIAFPREMVLCAHGSFICLTLASVCKIN
uniref:Uncharacterized protein n=1 Tax=Anguilla anguilla TaxID=7936 RepID=A0A0E9T0C3_ANGAN